MTKKDKFLSKIVKNVNKAGCWYLKSDDGTKFRDCFYFHQKKYKAKKFSYLHFIGDIKSGFKVLCRCGDNLCINPDHHFLGTGSDQIKLIMSRGWKHKKGWKQKPEILEIISKTHKGKTISPEMREHLRQMNLGKKHSLTTRKKMSKNRIGIPVKEEARRKIAESKQGEKNYNTRLTERDIINIRKLANKSSFQEIAEEFEVSAGHIYNIVRRKAWKHVK